MGSLCVIGHYCCRVSTVNNSVYSILISGMLCALLYSVCYFFSLFFPSVIEPHAVTKAAQPNNKLLKITTNGISSNATHIKRKEILEAVTEMRKHQCSKPVKIQNQGSSPVRGQNHSSSPVNKQHQGSSVVSKQHQGSSPVSKQHQCSSPVNKQHQGSSVVNKQHQGSSPVNKQHQGSSPANKQHQGLSPVNKRHQSSSPVNKQHQGSSVVSKQHLVSSFINKQHQGSAPVNKQHKGSSPVNKQHQGSSPINQQHQGLSPVTKQQSNSIPANVSHRVNSTSYIPQDPPLPKDPKKHSEKTKKYSQHNSKSIGNSSHRGSRKLLHRKMKMISDEATNCCSKPSKAKKAKDASKSKNILNGYSNDHKYQLLMSPIVKPVSSVKREPKLKVSGSVIQANKEEPLVMASPREPNANMNQISSSPSQKVKQVAQILNSQLMPHKGSKSVLNIVRQKKQLKEVLPESHEGKSRSSVEVSVNHSPSYSRTLLPEITKQKCSLDRKVQFAPGIKTPQAKRLSSPGLVKRSHGFREGLDRSQMAVRKVSHKSKKRPENMDIMSEDSSSDLPGPSRNGNHILPAASQHQHDSTSSPPFTSVSSLSSPHPSVSKSPWNSLVHFSTLQLAHACCICCWVLPGRCLVCS